MQMTTADLSILVDGVLEGDPNIIITGPSRIESGEEGTISFLANMKYEEYIYTSKASAFLVSHNFKPNQVIDATLIRVEDVYKTITFLLEKFDEKVYKKPVISTHAIIEDSAKLGKGISVGHHTVIEGNVEIGDDCEIGPMVFIEEGVQVGANVKIYPGCRIMGKSIIGNNCVIQANSVIGADGFGYLPDDNFYKKVPQLGNVILEDYVEIGSNCVVDRAVMGSTIIREGAKLDNLIQIGHNVEIGAHTVLAAQVGVAGSSSVGEWAQIGGQVGISGHIKVGNKVKIQAKSGVASSIEDETILAGNPAFSYSKFNRSYVLFRKLPEMEERIKAMEDIQKTNQETEETK